MGDIESPEDCLLQTETQKRLDHPRTFASFSLHPFFSCMLQIPPLDEENQFLLPRLLLFPLQIESEISAIRAKQFNSKFMDLYI